MWTAAETLGLALGPGVYGLVLMLGGYVSSTDGTAAQPDSALTAMTLGFTVLPALLVLGSLLLLRGYRIDEAAVVAAGEVAR
nr:MFS transporter [Janibacter sp. YB324]